MAKTQITSKQSGGRPGSSHSKIGNKNAIRKNLSKKDADKKRKIKEYNKGLQRKLKLDEKRKEFELRLMAKKKNLDQRKLENKKRADGDEWEDIDEHERDVFDKDGYFDVMDTEAAISASDQKLLQKISNAKERDEAEVGTQIDGKIWRAQTSVVDSMDPKIVASYKKVGVVMKTFRTGKLPKAFKCIPYLVNWEEFLYMTNPSSWSPQATFEATKIFASNLNANMCQRFYSLVLVDIVRGNIFNQSLHLKSKILEKMNSISQPGRDFNFFDKYKKLNCHLYMAVKKAMFKQGAFFKGFLIPLAQDATAREAVIIGSILSKMTINTLDAAATMLKLTHMEYQVGSGFFLKTLLAKKYALPTQVINALVEFFIKFLDGQKTFEEDELDGEIEMDESSKMPVMWHQTLLTLVQCYRPYLTPANCLKLKALVRVQSHPAITPEIRKCLAADYLQNLQAQQLKEEKMQQ